MPCVNLRGHALCAESHMLLRREAVIPTELKVLSQQRIAGLKKATVFDGVVGHPIARPHTTWLASGGGHQSDALHLGSPLFIVVPATTRLAEMLLPQVCHLMNQGLQGLDDRHHCEIRGIERDLIRGTAIEGGKARC